MVQAGRLITQALGYEGTGDYEEAFDLYKAGVDVLLNGVQSKGACSCRVAYFNIRTSFTLALHRVLNLIKELCLKMYYGHWSHT